MEGVAVVMGLGRGKVGGLKRRGRGGVKEKEADTNRRNR